MRKRCKLIRNRITLILDFPSPALFNFYFTNSFTAKVITTKSTFKVKSFAASIFNQYYIRSISMIVWRWGDDEMIVVERRDVSQGMKGVKPQIVLHPFSDVGEMTRWLSLSGATFREEWRKLSHKLDCTLFRPSGRWWDDCRRAARHFTRNEGS